MQSLQFLFGKNLNDAKLEIKPGKIYLDLATNELYYDDPSGIDVEKHNKIIDTATLIYNITETVTFPSMSGEDDDIPGGSGHLPGSPTSVLGVAVLGTMILGNA